MKYTISPRDASLIEDALMRRANEVRRQAAHPSAVAAGIRGLLLDDAQYLDELAARFTAHHGTCETALAKD